MYFLVKAYANLGKFKSIYSHTINELFLIRWYDKIELKNATASTKGQSCVILTTG